MILDDKIRVRLDDFDGPLALLLQLIKREEMDIRELDINLITKNYLEYIFKIEAVDFNLAGDYLFLAASLLYMKSKNAFEDFLGKKEDVVNEFEKPLLTREQLIDRLENLERYQKISGLFLKNVQMRGKDIFQRPKLNKKELANSLLLPMDREDLINVFIDLIQRNNRKYKVVKRDRLSIKEKLIHLKQSLNVGDKRVFRELLEKSTQEEVPKQGESAPRSKIIKEDIVITFISLLELARLKKIRVFQNENYGEIYVDVVESLSDFDVETANGFEPEDDGSQKEVDEDETVKENLTFDADMGQVGIDLNQIENNNESKIESKSDEVLH